MTNVCSEEQYIQKQDALGRFQPAMKEELADFDSGGCFDYNSLVSGRRPVLQAVVVDLNSEAFSADPAKIFCRSAQILVGQDTRSSGVRKDSKDLLAPR